MKRSQTWSPEVWGGLKRLPSSNSKQKLVARDAFFVDGGPADGGHTSSSRGSNDGHRLFRRGSSSPTTVATLHLFDVTASHGEECGSSDYCDASLEGRAAYGAAETGAVAARWVRVLAPELVALRPMERRYVVAERVLNLLGAWVGGVSAGRCWLVLPSGPR
jgi:hypothetical protein